MALLPVRTYPDPLLKTPAYPVEQITPAITTLIRDLIDTMRHHPRCVGLAAPQVGRSVRVAVVDVRGYPKAKRSSGLLVFVNPTIVAQNGSVVQREGCLSVPDLTANVQRVLRLCVQWHDASGQLLTKWFEDFEAVAVQHELDHLSGLLFLDRVTNVRRDVFRRTRYAHPPSPCG